MFKDRLDKAKSAVKFSHILNRNANNKPSSILIPGSAGKQYNVFFKRMLGATKLECRLMINGNNSECCKGSLKTICYHQMAAFMVCAEDGGFKVSWCETEEDADKVMNLHQGSKKTKVSSKYSDKIAYVVFWKG